MHTSGKERKNKNYSEKKLSGKKGRKRYGSTRDSKDRRTEGRKSHSESVGKTQEKKRAGQLTPDPNQKNPEKRVS